MLALPMYFPAARTEIQGEQNHTEYQLSNSTQLSVTLKPAVIDAVFFLYGWLAQCGRASPVAAVMASRHSTSKPSSPHCASKKGNVP